MRYYPNPNDTEKMKLSFSLVAVEHAAAFGFHGYVAT
jgi:hypothetical protein